MTILRILIIALIIWLIYKFKSKFKVPKVGSFALISGGVKTGKSTLSVYMVTKEIKKRQRQTKLYNFFRPHKKLDMPLLYSNVPLSVPYVPLTNDLLLRKERFVYGSVIYIQEASLVADSQAIKDKELNQNLLLLNKLIGHETRGGLIVYDTQCINDCHYSIKRCLSSYIYIHHLYKLPLLPFMVAEVRELHYSNDDTTINVFNEDVEDTLKKVLIPKKVWKYFDCYAYSSLTDKLPVNNNVVKAKTLKANNILSLKEVKKCEGKQ